MKKKEENNIFKFATKELSQDAFICWCINWINYPNSKLYNLGKDFLKMILDGKNIDIDEIKNVNIYRQYEKIDILLVIDNYYLVIIEDKIDSINHGQLLSKMGNQDKIYKNKLINLLSDDLKVDENGYIFKDKDKNKEEAERRRQEIHLREFKIENIFEVYVKTGKLTPIDNAVNAIKVDANKIIDILKKYVNENDMILAFYENLKLKMNLMDETRVEKIITNKEIAIGTKFRYRNMCFNCFYDYTHEKYDTSFKGHMDKRMHGGWLYLKDNIILWIPKLYKQKDWINEYDENNNIIKEINVNKDITMNHDEIRYVFVRNIDEFLDEYFEFVGLFYFEKMENCHTRIWKKCNLDNTTIPLDENKIKKIINNNKEN